VEALWIDGRRLTVCLSVGPVPDPKSRMEGHSKQKLAGRKPMTLLTRDPV